MRGSLCLPSLSPLRALLTYVLRPNVLVLVCVLLLQAYEYRVRIHGSYACAPVRTSDVTYRPPKRTGVATQAPEMRGNKKLELLPVHVDY